MALDADTFGQLIDTIRRFVAERLRPLEAQVADNDEIPDDLIEEMKALGLFGLSIPEEYGGLGLSMSEEVRVVFELGKTSPAFRSAFGTNVGIGSQGLVMAGNEAQKERFLPGIASGEIITSFALTEQPLKQAFANEAVSYYQTASHLFQQQLYRELSPGDFARYLETPAATSSKP